MATDDHLEPDRMEGVPHPRETQRIYGHDAAEAAFLQAFCAGRLHHAWLLSGPRGIGKASMAWRMARFLLATPRPDGNDLSEISETLDIPAHHPIHRLVLQNAAPGLIAVTRSRNEKTNRLRDRIGVDDIRRIGGFFQLSAADGGHRVVIIDAADEMNTAAANALLKMLEEPPARAVLLLVAHQPARLLPTIRSRCRMLRLAPLGVSNMTRALAAAGVDPGANAAAAITELSGGSVGAAMALHAQDGLALYARIVALLASLPRLDRPHALTLAEQGVAAKGASAGPRFDLILQLLEIALARMARAGATGRTAPEAAPEEAAVFLRLAPNSLRARQWAEATQTLLARARRGRAVNLAGDALILDTFFKLQEVARA